MGNLPPTSKSSRHAHEKPRAPSGEVHAVLCNVSALSGGSSSALSWRALFSSTAHLPTPAQSSHSASPLLSHTVTRSLKTSFVNRYLLSTALTESSNNMCSSSFCTGRLSVKEIHHSFINVLLLSSCFSNPPCHFSLTLPHFGVRIIPVPRPPALRR